MHKNHVWFGLLLIVSLATIWFVGKAAWQTYTFYRLSDWAAPQTMSLTVKKKSRNSYYPAARYTYEIEGKQYQGAEDLKSLKYYRKEFLEKDLQNIQKERKWKVWYSPSAPHISALHRSFPFKSLVYAFLMVSLMGYFLWLGLYVGRRYTMNQK